MELVLKILPVKIKDEILKLESLNEITEIRLRAYKKVHVYFGIVEKILEIEVYPEDLVCILKNVSSNSIYSVQQDINNGFVTMPGGHRIGVVGEVVLNEGRIKNIKNISSMNIRIAKEYIGISDKIINAVISEEKINNCIIVSPPLCGKTTLLRDVVRNISNKGKNVVVIDERGEITAMNNCKNYLDIGERTDVISYVPKEIGMQMAVRSMAPDVVVTDEIGTPEDAKSISYLCRCGVSYITTMHGDSIKDVLNSSLKDVLKAGYIDTIIVLSKSNGIGTIEKIYTDLSTNFERVL